MKEWLDSLPYRMLRWFYIRDLKKVSDTLNWINPTLLDGYSRKYLVDAQIAVQRIRFELVRERLSERKPR